MADNTPTPNGLEVFSEAARTWFSDNFGQPTPVQNAGWPLIARGDHGLLLAPTGSGKTLAAFLWTLDHLQSHPDLLAEGTGYKVVYVSPLKALVYDVERNLRAPLVGLERTRERLGLPSGTIKVDIRTGDTSQKERARMLRKPGDVLITTPESLYLMLSSRVKKHFASVQAVIVDEIHVLAGTKRGAHLAITLERLTELAEVDPQRIGLSATVRPPKRVAEFLGGYRTVEVVDTTAPPRLDLRVGLSGFATDTEPSHSEEADIEEEDELDASDDIDMDLDFEEDTTDAPDGSIMGALYHPQKKKKPNSWPELAPKLLACVRQHHTTIIFVNSRTATERLTQNLNELADEEIALAHHGSMAPDRREIAEERLKSGDIQVIVATSSLELGVDMGAVDLVILLQSPGAVSRGLQRVGRAGHGVGETSKGILVPRFKTDLLECVAVGKLMLEAEIEPVRLMRNPLDVLTQQLISICAEEDHHIDDLKSLVRRSQPFADISDAAFDGVLEMACGHYPSTEFSDLRPYLLWDRDQDLISGRKSAKRVAQSNAGTIPDRGLYTVRLGPNGTRLGELDEEMVFEAREGQTFVLGASTWRIEEITRDQVIVAPAPGEPGTLPFWHGSGPGRPLELGLAMGEMIEAIGSRTEDDAKEYLTEHYPIDTDIAADLTNLIAEQRESTGTLPTHRRIVVERFVDDLGDFRICILAPFGTAVNAPWAMALEAMLVREHGFDVKALWGDDGISLTLIDDGREWEDNPDRWLPDPDEVEDLIVEQIANTALFAGIFRENAGRALLLPRRYPGKRTPLWAQRLKSQRLLAVAKSYSDFPIVLETYRTCLRDVFDIETLKDVLRKLRARTLSMNEVETEYASPMARSLVFDYVAAWMYEGDAPLAERRAQALNLDRNLLRDLLGHAELRTLLDPEAIVEVEAELQQTDPDYHAAHADSVHDLLRRIGDLTTEELTQRTTPEGLASLETLFVQHRAAEVRVGGKARIIAAEDAGLYRDALGVVPPRGLPSVFLRSTDNALEQLVMRYARTHGPFTTAQVAERFFLRSEQVEPVLKLYEAQRQLQSGAFLPEGVSNEWCTPETVRRIRRRSLAKARSAIEPVDAAALSRFTMGWQGVLSDRGHALHEVLLQLEGLPIPVSELEKRILPARVANYQPRDLDLLTGTGEWIWVGHQSLRRKDGLVKLYRRDRIERLLEPPGAYVPPSEVHSDLLRFLSERGASFLFNLRTASPKARIEDISEALWDLVWAGLVTNDTFSPLRALGMPVKRKSKRHVGKMVGGRWALVETLFFEPTNVTERRHHWVQLLLRRYGTVLRYSVEGDCEDIRYSEIYPVLKAMEDVGRVQRGYFIDGVEGVQFAMHGVIDDLRRPVDPNEPAVLVALAAKDPANIFGRLLPWPKTAQPSHSPRREVGSTVALANGEPVFLLGSTGKKLTVFDSALAELPRDTTRDLMRLLLERHGSTSEVIESVNGVSISSHPFKNTLRELGGRQHPSGMFFEI